MVDNNQDKDNKQNAPLPPWEHPKIIAITSIFGGKVIAVKNIIEPTIRRTNNEAFYR